MIIIVDGNVSSIAGVLRVRRPLDREQQTSHKLIIRAVDVAKQSVFAQVPVHLTVSSGINPTWQVIHLTKLTFSCLM